MINKQSSKPVSKGKVEIPLEEYNALYAELVAYRDIFSLKEEKGYDDADIVTLTVKLDGAIKSHIEDMFKEYENKGYETDNWSYNGLSSTFARRKKKEEEE